jgi:hypothetical protein
MTNETLLLLVGLALLLVVFLACITAGYAWYDRNSVVIHRVLRLLLVVAIVLAIIAFYVFCYKEAK